LEKKTDILDKHHPYDCTNDLQESIQRSFGPIYNLLQNKLVAWKEYIDENHAKNFI